MGFLILGMDYHNNTTSVKLARIEFQTRQKKPANFTPRYMYI